MKIAIAGYGLEGESNYRYWSSDLRNEITIVDQKQPSRTIPDNVPTIIGEDAFERLDGFDLVIRTAGLSPFKIKTDGKIWSATNEFFEKCPASIIGVTGTKGKGTTSSLIASIFEAAGKKVWLVGNIGIASLDVLPKINKDDVVVFELSSFQLWDLERSPQIAVVLPIEPEHLDVHKNFDDYVGAKSNIRRHQKSGDLCVYHSNNEIAAKVARITEEGEIIRYGIADDGGSYVDGENFCREGRKICSVSSLKLVGGHNIENACAAITVAKFFDLSDEDIEKGLQNCHGLPYRLEFVREVKGVKYYNDSFSSSPSATVAAIKSFNQPEILIIGGIDRGADFSELCNVIAEKNNIKEVVIIGEIRHKLADMIKQAGFHNRIEIADNNVLESIVKLAESYAEPGDVVVLSPACASFDMFRDFYDRGDKFKETVNNL
ncbi:MAG: UDP-N-acetylmuramoyl-L-alanine--D-glutamate ligase [Candidatus Saccharimonadaceae bacterium]|nr:UDP-N-acetylmuramoyl-L-alanine--D-glutamate ligase [Candidatus Saccharimonadaceae bacterium]